MAVSMAHNPLWRPSEEAIAHANLTMFLQRYGAVSYGDLNRSVANDIQPFYRQIVNTLDLHWDRFYDELLNVDRGKPFARWFEGGELNAPANCLDRHIRRGRANDIAVIYEGEDGSKQEWSFAALYAEVSRLGNALKSLGVRKGDTVGIYLPLLPQTVAALLAIGYVGAIAVPAFSGYGEHALASRLDDAKVKVLITADGFSRRGKFVDMKTTADKAVAAVPSIEHVIVFSQTALDVPMDPKRDHRWGELVTPQSHICAYERTSANDPYMVLYTSGSTGKPKGAVHVHGGFPLKVMIDQHLCFDVRNGDRMLWFTDMGWMMGPFLVLGALGLGASIVLYDGTPDYPAPDRLWEVCERHRVTHLGIAPTAIRSLMAYGEEHPRKHDLSSLRILGSSGEPWNTEPYLWFLHNVGGGRTPIINYSGGTEIGGGIVSAVPTLPLVPNCFHGPCPGMVADVVDPNTGEPVRGTVGELVVREPFIGMTQSFWKSDGTRDDERYLASYWERLPGIWVHGDWAQVEPGSGGAEEFWYIRGRSDDTINVAGKRVGPAEFESAVVSDPDVIECAAIAVPDDIKGDVVVLLVVAKTRAVEGDPLRKRLLGIIDAAMGKALRPKAIHFVDELPKTRNHKVMRRVARARYLKLENLGDLSALENHTALAAIDAAR
ncbi:MAG TPA: AMP-binding protein [Candidatus Acidoferrales bacterium]|nr:AMP-binding protein [Candidatus Acidoferrales bacterium]